MPPCSSLAAGAMFWGATVGRQYDWDTMALYLNGSLPNPGPAQEARQVPTGGGLGGGQAATLSAVWGSSTQCREPREVEAVTDSLHAFAGPPQHGSNRPL